MILLSACVGMNFTFSRDLCGKRRVDVGVDGGIGPFGVSRVVFRIRSGLTCLRDDIPARRARLHPIPCGTETCYSLDEVRDAIAKIRDDAKAAFPEEALASRLTLDEELARAANHIAVFRRTSPIQLVRNAPESVRLVRAHDVDATFDRARKPINTYLGHGKLNPTLHIRSEPDGAQFRMLIGTNERTALRTATQNELKSVWRGRYTGTMTKKGYREVANFDINLFDNDDTTVRCTLVPNTAPDNAVSICRLKD